MNGYVSSVCFGIFTGMIFSYLFKINGTKTADSYTFSIFNMNSSKFIKMMLIFLTFFLIIVIGSLSLLIRDVDYPIHRPVMFTIETLLMGIIPASTLFVLYYLRGSPITTKGVYAFIILAMKCMVAHVLLQFSGIYSSIFKNPSF
jgi:hypothetical protein